MPLATRPAADLVADTRLEEAVLVTALKKLVKSETSRTEALRGFAEAIVILRLKLAKDLQLPLADVKRAGPYREAVARVYDKAGLTEDAVPDGTSRAALGASIRYHVAEEFRARGLAEEAGVSEDSPSQRLAGARAALAEKRSDPLQLLAPALTALSGVRRPNADLLALCDQLEVEIARLRGLAAKPRRRST